MRKALIGFIMAATVLTPVAAQAQDGGRAERIRQRYEAQGARNQQRSEQRQQRQEVRQQRQETSQQTPEVRQQRQEARQQRQAARQQRAETPQAQSAQSVQQPAAVRVRDRSQRQVTRQDAVTGDREAYRNRVQATREASRRSAEGLSDRYQRQAARNQQRTEQNLRQDRREYRAERREDRQERRWDRQWRNNQRYDWQSYRYSNRNLFRLGSYYAPYRNHRYSRLSIGLFLGSGFYGNDYRISDPWRYRLPQAYPGTQWVRYYDDVLLIDVYSGEVIDVIYDFFW